MEVMLEKTRAGYDSFLKIKALPVYSFRGRIASFPDEYADAVGLAKHATREITYQPLAGLFDYQVAITKLALRKEKFAVFADCGLGKSLIYFEFAKHTISPNGGALIITPNMVVSQLFDEAKLFYGEDLPVEIVSSHAVGEWLKTCGGRIGITNWEAMRNDLSRGQLSTLILDESSVLKSHYGEYGSAAIELGKGLRWKLCGTGTPAPNDRIEYANHAVFLDRFPTVNAYLARYFINRGQTQERWELRPHAIKPFYRSLSDWSIFLANPATYGWKDNCKNLPPIHVHIHDVDMTSDQTQALHKTTGTMFATTPGGITKRHMLSRIGKGLDGSETNKYEFIRGLVDSWPNESTIIWCWFNAEQDRLAAMFPDAASISGATPMDERLTLIADFKAGRRKVLISKPKVLGFGLNLQIATRQIFSSLIDSYEQYYQAVKRSNRVGSTRPLNVHVPVCDVERPMVENVLRKSSMVLADTMEQERIFKELGEHLCL